MLPLDRDQGRAFLYVRYDEELSAQGLSRLGLAAQMAPSRVAALDAVEHAAELSTVGRAIAQRVDLAHFAAFADPARAPLARH